MSRMVRILAVDGGGVRGLMPAIILNEIERRCAEQMGRAVRLCELFDVIAGTSTGAVITLLLSKPDPASGATLIQLYEADAKYFFHRSWLRALLTLDGWLGPKYSRRNAAALMRKYLGETTELKQAQTNIVIPIYALRSKWPRVVLFSKDWAVHREAEGFNFRMWEVGCAAGAAPTYFASYTLESLGEKKRAYHAVDGAVYINNPALEGLTHAMELRKQGKLKGAEQPREETATDQTRGMGQYLVVSVGTGYHDVPVSTHRATRWGTLGWAVPILDVIFEAQAEAASLQLEQMMPDHRYYRLQPALDKDTKLDDSRPATLRYLRHTTEHFVKEKSDVLDEIVKLLVSRD